MGRKGKTKGGPGGGPKSSSEQQQESAAPVQRQQQQRDPLQGQERQQHGAREQQYQQTVQQQPQQQKGPPNDPQGARGQQRQQLPQQPQQQRPSGDQVQQQQGPPKGPQGARGQQRQQLPQQPQQQRPSGDQVQQQQGPPKGPQGAWGQQHQQLPQQPQQQRPSGDQVQQQQGPPKGPQGAWGQQRQQLPQQPQQQRPSGDQVQQQQGPPKGPQGAWGQQHQQLPQQPQQQRPSGDQVQQQQGPPKGPQGARGQQRQQLPQQPQQQRPSGDQVQQQQGPPKGPQGAWGQQRQQLPQQPQQQRPSGDQVQQQQGPPKGPQGAWGQQRQQLPQQQQWHQQSTSAQISSQVTTDLTSQMQQQNIGTAGRGRGDGRRGRGNVRTPGGREDARAPGGNNTAAQRQPPQRSPSVVSSTSETASVKSSEIGATKKPSTALTNPTEKKTVPEHEKTRLISLIPRRKDPLKAGTQGRPITVYTNMMKIILGNNLKISATHYDVKFDPERPKYIKQPAFNALRKAHFPNSWPAFDGRVNVYSAGDLPFGHSLTTEVVFFDDEWQKDRTVKVVMEKVNVIDLSWLKSVKPGITERERDQTTMQVLDVILRMAPYNRAIMVGRSFFQQPRRPAFDLSDGMELWVGMFQSAVLGWKPYFNVDVAHKAFPKSEAVIDVMKDLCTDRRTGRPQQLDANIVCQNRDKIKQHLTGLKVIFQLPNQPSSKRTVGVNGLDKSASEAVFELDNGETTTVEKYFIGSKKYKIQYPHLPCLWVGSRTKRILLPAELCKVAPGVVTNRKLGEEQTRRMIRETAKDTNTRKDRIMESFNQMEFNSDPTMREFGISLDGKFEKVDARVLTPPILQYEKNTATVQKGVWRPNGYFRKPSTIPDNQWTILNLCQRMNDNTLHTFVESLRHFGGRNGMMIGKPTTPFEKLRPPGRDTRELLRYFEDRKKAGIKLILVVIPGFQADVYPKVKQQAELYAGILTQCVKENTVDKVCGTRGRPDDATAGNILLKINSKMNGINHEFASNGRPQCLDVPTIIFGADVTHPSPDATEIPSIAAVAASHSRDVFKYNVMIRLQPPRQEIIVNLEEIVIEQLKIFERNNEKKRPQKIFFYRDGVSEGQFPTVMHHELQAIRNACKKFGGPGKYEPKITFLVVQKRHHIRLFPTDSRNSDDRNNNVQAGTIVDTTITHPSHIDFYLVSHASIQGTARPTKYRCLWDDNDMSEDEIEKLTYYLCHMFSRCNRSVSYPAPTYYAHLAAFRARALTYGVDIQMNNLEQAQKMKLTLKPDLVNNNPMFFV